MTDTTSDLGMDVVIIKPGHPAVTYGPMPYGLALEFDDRICAQMHNTTHPDGTKVQVEPHTEACTHDVFDEAAYTDPEQLATMAEYEPGGGADFPDTYTRLVALCCYPEAQYRWDQTLAVLSARERIGENVAGLVTVTQDAYTAVGGIRGVVAQLVADYDVELVEDAAEADIKYELDVAERALRNIERIAKLRAALG